MNHLSDFLGAFSATCLIALLTFKRVGNGLLERYPQPVSTAGHIAFDLLLWSGIGWLIGLDLVACFAGVMGYDFVRFIIVPTHLRSLEND